MVLICLHLPLHEHLIIELQPESTAHTSIDAESKLPKASVEAKQRMRKFQASEILSGTPYKKLLKVKKKRKQVK
jgi:hypothetical protein